MLFANRSHGGAFLVLCFSLVLVTAVEVLAETEPFTFVFFNPDNESQDPVTAVSAMKPFGDYIGEEIGRELKVHYILRRKDLESLLSKTKVGMGLFDPVFIIQNKDRLGLEPCLIPVMAGDNDSFYYIYIVTRKKDGYKSLDDLRGKSFAYTALGDDNFEYLNKVVFQGKMEVQTHFSKLIEVTSPSSAVMAVIYGQADSAGVSYGRFETMKELNPIVGRDLEVLYKSPKITVATMCFFKDNTTPEIRQKLTKLLLAMHETALGQQTLIPFRVQKFNEFSNDLLKPVEDLLASAKTLPPSGGKEIPRATAAKVKETASTPEAGLTFGSLSQSYLANDNVVRIMADVKSKEEISSVELISQVQDQPKVTTAMKMGTKGLYSADVKLPEIASTGEEKDVEYIVQPGDTLGKISKKYYGEIKKWIMIATYNRLANPNIIVAGQRLKVKVSGKFENVMLSVWVKGTTKSGIIAVSNKEDVLVTR